MLLAAFALFVQLDLSQVNHVTYLFFSLERTDLSDLSARPLLDNLPKSLTSLNLSSNPQLSPEFFTQLTAVYPTKLSRLLHFDLSNNRIGDRLA